jgi:hypothetical protein
MKIIFRLILLGGIAIIMTAFYMRIYCHDHTSLSAQTPQHFLSEEFIHSSIIIMEDNQSIIKIIYNSEDRKRIRYINIRYHFIRQFVNKEEVEFQ